MVAFRYVVGLLQMLFRGCVLPLRKWAMDGLRMREKLDGYREKKMQRNSRRETERWTEKQTDSKDRDRVRVMERRKKRGRELKKPQQNRKAHWLPFSLWWWGVVWWGSGTTSYNTNPFLNISSIHPVRDKVTVNHITTFVHVCVRVWLCVCACG